MAGVALGCMEWCSVLGRAQIQNNSTGGKQLRHDMQESDNSPEPQQATSMPTETCTTKGLESAAVRCTTQFPACCRGCSKQSQSASQPAHCRCFTHNVAEAVRASLRLAHPPQLQLVPPARPPLQQRLKLLLLLRAELGHAQPLLRVKRRLRACVRAQFTISFASPYAA